MKNLLDLRSNKEPEVIVVEKVIEKPRVFFQEFSKVVLAIAIISISVWGISKANFAAPPDAQDGIVGIYGSVTATSSSIITIDDSQGSKYLGIDTFYADVTNVKTVLTNDDPPLALSLSDIKVGDTIIARGTIEGSKINVQDIISFSYVQSTSTTATSTMATSTDVTSTTDVIATSTDATSSDATSTVATSTNTTSIVDTLGTLTDATSTAATSTLSNFVTKIITGVATIFNSNSTSTDATSTVATSTTDTPVPIPAIPVIDASSSDTSAPVANPITSPAN